MPYAAPNIISQEAVNFITSKVYGELDDVWLPDTFIVADPTAQNTNVNDLDIEHFCAGVVHPNHVRDYHPISQIS